MVRETKFIFFPSFHNFLSINFKHSLFRHFEWRTFAVRFFNKFYFQFLAFLGGKMNSTTVCFHIGEVSYKYNECVVVIASISIVLNLFGTLFASIGNILVIYVILRKTALQKASNILLVCLSISDFGVAILAQPLSVVLRLHEAYDIQLCSLKSTYGALSFITGICSVTSLSCISVDRCWAVSSPLKYKTKDELAKTIYIVINTIAFCISTVAVSLAYTGIIAAKAFIVFMQIFISLASIIIGISYFKIHRAAKARSKRIQELSITMLAVQCQDAKRNKTVAVILVTFYVLFLPKFIHKICMDSGVQNSDFAYAARITETIIHLNSSFNPCIYMYTNQAIRAAVKETLSNMWQSISFVMHILNIRANRKRRRQVGCAD